MTTSTLRAREEAMLRNTVTERCVFSWTPTAAPRNAMTMTSSSAVCSTHVGVAFQDIPAKNEPSEYDCQDNQ